MSQEEKQFFVELGARVAELRKGLGHDPAATAPTASETTQQTGGVL